MTNINECANVFLNTRSLWSLKVYNQHFYVNLNILTPNLIVYGHQKLTCFDKMTTINCREQVALLAQEVIKETERL